MWFFKLQKHFPQRKWKKYYRQIIFYIFCVNFGLKPSFMWDFGPVVTVEHLSSFIHDLKISALISEQIVIISVNGNFFITNITQLLLSLHTNFIIMDITKSEKEWFLARTNEFVLNIIDSLRAAAKTHPCNIVLPLQLQNGDCLPSIFGILLGYPLIYYFDLNYPAFPVALKLFTATCQFQYLNIAEKFQVYSFSIPAILFNGDIEFAVSEWFNQWKNLENNFFRSLKLECVNIYLSGALDWAYNENFAPELGNVAMHGLHAQPHIYGLINEAAHYFRKCLDIQPYFLQAFRNLKSISNLVVPRWHFRMLNDYKRNRAFREAIIKKIKKGYDSVLDIGTGTGILSLFALEAGAKRVTACDTSSFMIEIANQVIAENNSRSIHLLNKHSFDVVVPQDIPTRVKLVVTEIMDCGLLGEQVLETLIDAWERLLLPPATNSDSEAEKGAVIPSGAFIFVAGIECDNISKTYFLTESIKKYFDFENCIVQYNEESYDCKNLKALREGWRYLTDTYKTSFINFNDPESLKKFFSGDQNANITLKCSESGRMDSLVVWFNLYVDEEIVLSTAPHSDSNDSWDQAIFPLPNSFIINKYDEISINMSFKDGKISFHDLPLKSLKINNSVQENCEVFHPTEEVMKILNSLTYQNSFLQIIKLVYNKFKMKNVSILDTFPFPFFGLKYLLEKRNSKNFVLSVVQSEEDRRFIRFLAKKYNVENQITFIMEEELFKLEENSKFDIMLLNFFEGNGELKDELILHFDSIMSLLKSDGLLLPEKITVIGQFIESDWLDKMSKVIDDDVTFGYRIAKYLNIYQVNSHIDFDLVSIPKIFRSEPFELFEVTSGQFISKLNIPIVPAGIVNAMAYWYRINFITDCTEISTLEDTIIKQSALLFPPIFVSLALEFTIIYDNGLFKIQIHNQNEANTFS